jgi:hypothetical protein
MKCPNCNSEDVRRSRRRGPQEGLTLRIMGQAPFRCRSCDLRFTAKKDGDEAIAHDRHISFANYLGLSGWQRRVFSDDTVFASLLALLLLVFIIAFFALALGWIDPMFLRTHADWQPTTY